MPQNITPAQYARLLEFFISSNAGVITDALIQSVSAAKITGTLTDSQIASLNSAKLTAGSFTTDKFAPVTYANTGDAQTGTDVSKVMTAAATLAAILYRLPQHLIVHDQKSSGTNGGTFTAGAWRTRDLNTVVYNTITGASLASNQITLPAGTYLVRGSAPAIYINQHKARVYDTTNTATLILGSSEYSQNGAAVGFDTNRSVLLGKFTLTGNTVIELQHQCQTTQASNGFGVASSLDTEVYSVLEITKIS